MNERKCGRCGKTFTSMRPTLIKVTISAGGEWLDADLCDGCYGELTSWWSDKKNGLPMMTTMEFQ